MLKLFFFLKNKKVRWNKQTLINEINSKTNHKSVWAEGSPMFTGKEKLDYVHFWTSFLEHSDHHHVISNIMSHIIERNMTYKYDISAFYHHILLI